jgi:TrmH family RNA methyltransferase
MVIAVAFIEPQYEINVGYVARIMKNFGFEQMYITNPRFNEEDAARFSTHGKDILASAKIVTLKELRKTFDVLVGTTALSAYSRLNVLRDSISAVQLSEIIKETESEKDFCLVIGRETSGLNNRELEICDLFVVIDTKSEYKTMNISHALAILLYEISKIRSEIPLKKNKRNKELATRQEMDLLINYVNKVADRFGYDKHKQPMLNSAVQRLLARGTPTSKETMLLISLFRKSLLAIEREKTHRLNI